jgi:hypothetical protein
MAATQNISHFISEQIGKHWGSLESTWGWHAHPDGERLSAEFLENLFHEFGEEAATRSTAELLCFEHRPQALEAWTQSAKWKEAELRLRVGFGAWLWQAHHPSDLAKELFLREIEWQTREPLPSFIHKPYLAGYVLISWLGKASSIFGFHIKPIRQSPDTRSLEMMETIIRREWMPWIFQQQSEFYGQGLVTLKTANRMDHTLLRQALTVTPGLAICNAVCNTAALEPELSEIIYEFAAELTEENSHRFCYFSRLSGARWVIRACENVERLGLSTLASSKPDAYDRNFAIRKIAAIEQFLPTDDLNAFKAELSRFSPATRRLIAGSSTLAREDLLDDPACSMPPAYDAFKTLFLSCNRALHTYFDNSSDPTDGVLPVVDLLRLAEGLGEVGRAQLLEEFVQMGDQAQHAVLLLKGLFGIDRKKIEASVARSSQAAVKAYSLYPLPYAEPARTKDLAERYARIQDYTREAAKLKAGRRLNCLAAARVALANLAQVAGFHSTIAMELEIITSSGAETEQLPTFEHESLHAHLKFTPGGPVLVIEKAGRVLKIVPPALKKVAGFKAFQEQMAELSERYTQFSLLFEDWMISQTPIPKDTLAKLLKLPLSRWLLQRLLLADENTLGVIDAGGNFIAQDGSTQPTTDGLHIVHPVELSADSLASWRAHFKSCELEPPFQQLERETHRVLAEEAAATLCNRFAGVSLDCDKALRIFTKLGWSAGRVDYPFFYKAFPAHGLRATLLPGNAIASLTYGDEFVTDSLSFSPLAEYYFDHYDPLPLGQIREIAFSETIRDLSWIKS